MSVASEGQRFSVPAAYEYAGLATWAKNISDFSDTFIVDAAPATVTLASQAGGKSFLAVTPVGALRQIVVYLSELGGQLAGSGLAWDSSAESLVVSGAELYTTIGDYLTYSGGTAGTLNVHIDNLGAQLAGTGLDYDSGTDQLIVNRSEVYTDYLGSYLTTSTGGTLNVNVDTLGAAFAGDPTGIVTYNSGGDYMALDVNVLSAFQAGGGLTSSSVGTLSVSPGTGIAITTDNVVFDGTLVAGTGITWLDGQLHATGSAGVDLAGLGLYASGTSIHVGAGFGISVAGTSVAVDVPNLAGAGLTGATGSALQVAVGTYATITSGVVDVDYSVLGTALKGTTGTTWLGFDGSYLYVDKATAVASLASGNWSEGGLPPKASYLRNWAAGVQLVVDYDQLLVDLAANSYFSYLTYQAPGVGDKGFLKLDRNMLANAMASAEAGFAVSGSELRIDSLGLGETLFGTGDYNSQNILGAGLHYDSGADELSTVAPASEWVTVQAASGNDETGGSGQMASVHYFVPADGTMDYMSIYGLTAQGSYGAGEAVHLEVFRSGAQIATCTGTWSASDGTNQWAFYASAPAVTVTAGENITLTLSVYLNGSTGYVQRGDTGAVVTVANRQGMNQFLVMSGGIRVTFS